MSTRKSPFNRIKDMIPSIIERRAAINKTLTFAKSKKESPNEGSLRRRKAKMPKFHRMPERTQPLRRFSGTIGNANNAVLKSIRTMTGKKTHGAKENKSFIEKRGPVKELSHGFSFSRFPDIVENANNAVLKRIGNLTGKKPRGAKQHRVGRKTRGAIKELSRGNKRG